MDHSLYSYIAQLPVAAQATICIGALFAVASFIAKDILILRSLFAFGTLFFFITGIITVSPVMILINFLHTTINTIQIIHILIERYSLSIPEELRAVYYDVFSIMKPKEFLSLIKLGEKITTNDTKVDFLFHEGDEQDVLILILSGEVNIEKSGRTIAKLGKHNFVGEMHFLTNKPMTADVRVIGEITYIRWHHARLHRIKVKNPMRYANILTILGQDLIQKIQNTALIHE
jgi:hypothetical protein